MLFVPFHNRMETMVIVAQHHYYELNCYLGLKECPSNRHLLRTYRNVCAFRGYEECRMLRLFLYFFLSLLFLLRFAINAKDSVLCHVPSR